MSKPQPSRRAHAPFALGALAAAALTCAVVLAGCGTKKDTISAAATKRFTVMLDFFPNADHAALYSAIAHGDFRAVGLDVQPQAPADPAEPLKLLAAGRVDMAISYEPELLLARDQNVGFNLVPAMLSGRVDATIGGFWNYEAIQLRLLHKRPVVIPVDQAGVPTYDELVLTVREDEARTRGQDLRAFLQALTRGQREVRADPAAATRSLTSANPSLDAKLQLESISQTLPAEQPADPSKPFGWQDPSAWATFGSWMFSKGLLGHNPNGGLPPLTNEFLPGQGL